MMDHESDRSLPTNDRLRMLGDILSPHTSSLSDEQSNYGIDCTAVKAG